MLRSVQSQSAYLFLRLLQEKTINELQRYQYVQQHDIQLAKAPAHQFLSKRQLPIVLILRHYEALNIYTLLHCFFLHHNLRSYFFFSWKMNVLVCQPAVKHLCRSRSAHSHSAQSHDSFELVISTIDLIILSECTPHGLFACSASLHLICGDYNALGSEREIIECPCRIFQKDYHSRGFCLQKNI